MGNIFSITSDIKTPQVILCHRNYERIGELVPINSFNTTFSLFNPNEIKFTTYYETDNIKNPYWDKIANLKVVYIPEYDEYYEIEVSENDSSESSKVIIGQSLCESELSNLSLTIEINTESDIEREDYEPTIIYNSDKPNASLLHRVLKDKAPHYQILHVDESIARLQRSFSVSKDNIDNFLRSTLATEIECVVIYDTTCRGISLYDLASTCNDCGHRSQFQDECPECGSHNIKSGYGKWTNVYVSKNNLADGIELTAEKSTIKNCFRVVGGDDVITNNIPAVNPNGSAYISCFSELQYEDMPEELVSRLKSYNALVDSKRSEYKQIMQNIYKCIDQKLYYESGMMPSPKTVDTNATKELAKLTSSSIGTIGIANFSSATTKTIVDRAILTYAQIFMNPGYEVSISSSTYSNGVWSGRFHVESTSYPEEDYADNTSNIRLNVDGDAVRYIMQKIDKALASDDLADEVYDYTLYGIIPLQNFYDAYQSCLDILIEHGDSVDGAAGYSIYQKYYNLLGTVQDELNKRQATYDSWDAKQNKYEKQKNDIQKSLDMQNYLGDILFKQYCSYRRDDTYENTNYISDGLSDSEILECAEQLLECAQKELKIACQNQYKLSSSLYNLFLMEEFEPFHDKCELGNWLYAEVNKQVFVLRLVKISVDYDSHEKISVEFSNASKIYDGTIDARKILSDAQNLASSYPATARQVVNDSKITGQVADWINNGLDATNIMLMNSPLQDVVIDEHGIWCRAYDDVLKGYDPCQLRVINSTLAVTDDNWEHTKTAVGKYIYQDPETGEYKYAYGLIGETIVGRLILGEQLGLYNNGNTMKFDKNGLSITNGKNTFTVNPNSNELLALSNTSGKILYVDTNGVLHISGDGAGLDISLNDSVRGLQNSLQITAEGLAQTITSVDGRVTNLTTTVDGLSTSVSNAQGDITSLKQTTNSLSLSVAKKIDNTDYNTIMSLINLDENGIKIQGNKIDIIGNTTFSSLSNNVNNVSSDLSGLKTGLSDGTTIINGGCITTGTIDANKVNVINVKAASVDAENITGTTIKGKTIKGGNIEGTNLNGCAGAFTGIFLYNRDLIDSYQHGSICGQYVDDDGTIHQLEVMRVNNMKPLLTTSAMRCDAHFYVPLYVRNSLTVNATEGINFGSVLIGGVTRPAYINYLDNYQNKNNLLIMRFGFKYGDDIPALEIYDTFSATEHKIECKVFGDLKVDGSINQQSSRRYKDNIFPLQESQALKLLDYEIVSFDYVNGCKNRHGMIAEDAYLVDSYAVKTDSDGNPDSISYTDLIPDIIKLNQIMYKEIQALRREIKNLKSQ